MELVLDPIEARVFGSLIEKEITTPEYYPLTLNALVAACNQKSNRHPTVNYEEAAVSAAMASLGRKGVGKTVTGAGSRVPKHAHRIGEALNLGRRETALLCVLLLRGPQTLGELRDRTERMHDFLDTDEVESVLRNMAAWPAQPLVTRLDPAPGQKEPRYAHLLSGEAIWESPSPHPSSPPPAHTDRLAALESEVQSLRDEVATLRRLIDDFRRQFE